MQGLDPGPAADTGVSLSFQDQLRDNLAPGPYFEADKPDIALPAELPVKLIAYYLPQFHPIRENDEWWGKGFTEWTNVTKAVPQFEGHYQPHLPTALGFYDLRVAEVMQQQWEMAGRHGVGGFCFHYYWFSGRRILETPLDNLLANPDINIPFCINWANENWTRTWDGSEREILLAQSYTPADDLAFIESLVPLVQDPRYIRIDGRPLIMIYQPTLLPDIVSTVAIWRERFQALGLPNPYLVMPQAFGAYDPRPLGFDAVAGFPPHRFMPEIRANKVKTRAYNDLFASEVLSYKQMAEVASALDPKDYTLFHGVCPAWDNTARRPHRGLMFVGSTPALYGEWLANACSKVIENNTPDERIVFINAWNEWAEGAHLEPDRHNGFAYLRETARVLNRVTDRQPSASVHLLKSKAVAGGDLRGRTETARSLVHRTRNKLASGVERVARILRPA